MTTLIAKPVVKDQYWVVTSGGKKVGNVSANAAGFELRLNGINTNFTSTAAINRKVKIQFQPITKTNKTEITLPFAGFPTSKHIYNSIIDVRRKLHIFTKTPKSKCYYAAGWFVLDLSGKKKIILCPKYIFIERYPYYGPFKIQKEAENMINTN